ncbi:MAG: FkbM family methyltransferase [Sedimentisphaerales bacterium]|nr:FkbM family methyltransferase [Sedimentisphaerales bacterium]
MDDKTQEEKCPNPAGMELHSYSKNIHSQFGEDGIIEEILNRLHTLAETNGWCVELGAWDGMYLSNTLNLISAKGYKAVLIEGDKEKYRALVKNISYQDVYKICTYVSFDGDNSLDNILKTTPIPIDFDFLSVDIDGCDYYIFESLRQYQPKIVCIEYNPSIPNEVDFIQSKDFSVKQGASAKSLIKLAAEKGYSPVAITECNLILVRNELLKYVLGDRTLSLGDLRDDLEAKTYLFVGYDGTILSNKKEFTLFWHGITLETSKMQVLPKYVRTYSSDYNILQKIVFHLWFLIKRPGTNGGSLSRINSRSRRKNKD